jgi:excisionase family DNA binding protein
MQVANSALLVGVPEAAERLGLGLSTVKSLIQRNALRSITVGKRRLIPVAALEEFIADQLAASAE